MNNIVMDDFIEALLSMTKAGELQWKPVNTNEFNNCIVKSIIPYDGDFEYFLSDSSFFCNYNEGIIVLACMSDKVDATNFYNQFHNNRVYLVIKTSADSNFNLVLLDRHNTDKLYYLLESAYDSYPPMHYAVDPIADESIEKFMLDVLRDKNPNYSR